MSVIEIKIPSPGESISTVELYKWLVEDGAIVKQDMEIAELESDKATLMLTAEKSGKISLKVKEGDVVDVGSVACTIDTSVQPEEKEVEKESSESSESSEESAPKQKAPEEKVAEQKAPKEKAQTVGSKTESDLSESELPKSGDYNNVKVTPLAQKVMDDSNLSVDDVIKGLKRLRKENVLAVKNAPEPAAVSGFKKEPSRNSKSERLSSLRRKLSERLVSVKNETAMLTTFNEVDMKPIMDIRKKYQQDFVQAHGIKLGMMSFFMKAASVALQEFPNVNSIIDGENLVTYEFTDISVAVSTNKGLMVPVVRNVESLGLAEIEKAINELAEKARVNKLSIPEMTGGTFTITNGGIFGSMLSTPLINPPQSAILGMHNILERPVAIDGQVVVRPMMYIALSYDHRVIDGRDSVSFLKRIKQLLENPTDLLYGGNSGEKILLEL